MKSDITFSLPPSPRHIILGPVVDRNSIMQQLLNTSKNPFTNMEMSVDDLVPMPELKLKIEEWLKKQRGN